MFRTSLNHLASVDATKLRVLPWSHQTKRYYINEWITAGIEEIATAKAYVDRINAVGFASFPLGAQRLCLWYEKWLTSAEDGLQRLHEFEKEL
ncbi:hypothetical protein ACQ4M3_00940 [Leptolyngbya sp. AN03gr2]|uniref:hypothetical protein n=1 Tax=unclassified Leptolyngbya TaxID=2650499 RepID=UPI003D32123D